MNIKNTKLTVVIVCYEPDVLKLFRLCNELIHSGCHVVLIDNSIKNKLSGFEMCEIITVDGNTGIAYAQNIGIKYAVNNGAEVIAFFDQDSVIDDTFMSFLIEPLSINELMVVAPQYVDFNTNLEYPSYRLNKLGLVSKVYTNGDKKPYSVDIVISSGMAATIDVFKIVGLMDEGLYIDFVDTEWCLRCKEKSVPILLVPNAKMRHSIGDGSVKFYFLTIIIHTPIRCYYQIRNCIHLFRKDSVPIMFSAKEMLSVLINKFLLLFVVKNKRIYFSSYISALYDGIIGVNGKK